MRKKYILCFVTFIFSVLFTACGKDFVIQEGKYAWNKNLDHGREIVEIQVEKEGDNYILKLTRERRMGNMVLGEFCKDKILISEDTDFTKPVTVRDDEVKNSYQHQFIIKDGVIRWRYALLKDDEGKEVEEDISTKKYIKLTKQS